MPQFYLINFSFNFDFGLKIIYAVLKLLGFKFRFINWPINSASSIELTASHASSSPNSVTVKFYIHWPIFTGQNLRLFCCFLCLPSKNMSKKSSHWKFPYYFNSFQNSKFHSMSLFRYRLNLQTYFWYIWKSFQLHPDSLI
jgi:hypothetical protein